MKKIISICTVLILCLTLTVPAFAQESDFSYKTIEGGISITKYNGSSSDITIPDSIDGLPVIDISDRAFSKNTSVSSVTIPAGVTFIGENVFSGTASLKAINVDAQNSVYASTGTILYKKTNNRAIAYACGSETSNFILPSYISTIAPYCFSGAKNLKSVVTNSSLTEISNDAFADCAKLTSVYVVSEKTIINSYLFGNDASGKTVYYNGEISFIENGPSFTVKPYTTETKKVSDKPKETEQTASPESESTTQALETTVAETTTVEENTSAIATDDALSDNASSNTTKRNTTLIVCVVIVVLTLCAGGILIYLYLTKKKTGLSFEEILKRKKDKLNSNK